MLLQLQGMPVVVVRADGYPPTGAVQQHLPSGELEVVPAIVACQVCSSLLYTGFEQPVLLCPPLKLLCLPKGTLGNLLLEPSTCSPCK